MREITARTRFYFMILISVLGMGIFASAVFAASTIGTNINTTGSLTADGALKFTSGAVNNYILKTDATGNAVWISVSTALGQATSDDLPEGAANFYYTDAKVNTVINGLKGAPNGLAPLDASSLVPIANLPAGVPGGLAMLDGGGLILPSEMPSLAINNTYIVADQAARLALSANIGDVAVQTDDSVTYILQGLPASNNANWVQIYTPAQVVSFNGRTGVVTPAPGDYTANDVGLGAGSTPTFTGLTLSGLTPGSMIFASAGGAIAEDNANIFWDGLNQRLGVGTNTPSYALDVAGDIKAGNGSLVLLGTKTDPDPAGVNGGMYYNLSNNKFRCFENSSWKDCDTTGGTATLQSGYDNGATITTAGAADIALTLTSGNFTASGAGSVDLTPTSASQFTSGGALTLTGGADSAWSTSSGALAITSAAGATWGTAAGDLKLQAAGAGTTGTIQIGVGGAGSANPDLFALDVKSNAGDPAGFNGAMYYNSVTNKFRCYINGSWGDCDTTGGSTTMQSAYNAGAGITTAGSTDVALTLASGNFTAAGAGSVNLTPTGASSFTSGGALTLTAGGASTWSTTSGALAIDSGAALNLGTTNATGVNIGKSVTTTTINGTVAIPNYIDFNNVTKPAATEGALFYDYDNDAKTLAYFNETGSYVHIGRDTLFRVKNNTGGVLNNGEAVYINGDDGLGIATVTKAKADAANTSEVVGLVQGGIASGSYGYVMLTGLIENMDTSAYLSGDQVFLSPTTSGGLTSVKPTQPNYRIDLGYVTKSDATTGSILVNVGSAYKPGALTTGSVLFGKSDGEYTEDNTNLFWDNSTKRLGIGDNTPAASLTVGSGDMFEVFGASGNVTTQGDITLATGGGNITATGGGLTLSGAGASSLTTSSGALTLSAAGSGATSTIQIGAGGAGSTTPDLLAVDVKSDAGDPVGANGSMYYNASSNRFRCYENSAWKDCDAGVVASFQTAYNNGGAVTTSAGNPIAFTLTAGDFTAAGAGAVNLTPTSASSFTSGAALTLTGGAASTWSTTTGDLTLQAGSGTISLGTTSNLTSAAGLTTTTGSGNITLQPAGTGTTGNVQIGIGGAGSTTPDLLSLDVKSTTGDPAGGVEGQMYYNTFDNSFRCFVDGGGWQNCDTTGGTATLQSSYNAGNTISTGGTNIALTLNTTDQLTATGAGSVNLTPTGASSFTSGGALTLTGGAASTWGTSAGDLTLQAAGSGSTANIKIGAGGAGSTTPDLLALDVKSDAGDPAGFNGAMYYSTNLNAFRCYVNGGWQDCGATAASATTLQQAYTSGNTITTTGSTDLSVLLSSGNFTASGTGSVNLTPTGASSFTSGGALTLTGGAASTWGTAAGNLNLQVAGTGVTANVQVGAGGAGSATPDFLALDVKSTTGDPAGGAEGYMYYNTFDNKFRCYENAAWKDCDTGGIPTLQSVYDNGNTIVTAGFTDVALTLTSGNFTASGAGSVNLTPTGASSFTSGGALTLTAGAASTFSTSAGALTVDSAAALNLGTTNATAVSIGSTSVTTTINGPLSVSKYADFTSAAAPSNVEGRLFYDSAGKSLSYYNDTLTNPIDIAQTNLVRVHNSSGSAITKGQIVYINGVDVGTNLPTIALAKADVHSTVYAVGMVDDAIPDGTSGYIVTVGKISNLDTSAFSAGDPIFLSATTAGVFTATKPIQPAFTVPIGYVTKSNATTGVVLADIAPIHYSVLTAGDVPFGGSDGHEKADGTNLFWDNSTKRLGIGDNTPTATLSIGAGDLFQVFGASGNVTTQGDLTLTTGGGNITSTGGGLVLSGAGASSLSTTTGALTLAAAGSGTTSTVQIGVGGAGSTTPDFLALDVKSDTSDPAGGAEGYMYYNTFDNKFRCYENAAWKDCDTTGGTITLQSVYNSGGAITTSGADVALTLTSGNFTATGAGAVNLTPTSASSFTSGGALTLTGGAASTWSTSSGALTLTSAAAATWGTAAGDLKLQAAGTGTTAAIQIGAGGVGSTTPDLLIVDVKSDAGDPAGTNGAMYYNASTNKLRCYENGAWRDCDTTSAQSLQTAYSGGATITTAGSTNIAFTLTSGNFAVSGAGAVNLTPTSASSFTSGGALTFTGGAASTWGTTSGALTLQAAGTGTSSVKIGTGGAGSTTPDLLALDVKSDAGDPVGANGAMYYNASSSKFRCFEAAAWKDCDLTGATSLQTAYNGGATITTAGATNIAYTLTSGNFTASGAGAVNLTPTSASSFTSGGALTLTGGAASTWSTSAGALTVDSAAALNLGTTNATSVSLGKTGITTTNNGSLTSTQLLTASNGLTQTTGALNLTATSGALTLSGMSASSINTGVNGLTLIAGALTITGGAASTWSTSAGALTITSAAAATWGTTAGDLTFQAAGSGTIGVIHIGAGGAGSTTPDYLALDVKSTTGDPAGGVEGEMYYNTFDNKFRCFVAAAWADCDGGATGGASSANYVYAYDTTVQALTTKGTFKSVTFANTPQLNGWTYSAGNFTAPATGLYMVTAIISINNNTANTTMAGQLRATFNGVEVAGSNVTQALRDTASHLSNVQTSFIVSATAGQNLAIQFTANCVASAGCTAAAASGITIRTAPTAGPAGAGTPISANLTIVRIQ